MVTVGINAHLLSEEAGYRRAGIHHYIENVLAHLPQTQEWRYTVFSRYRPGSFPSSLEVVKSSLPTQNPLVRILWEQTAWPLALQQRQLDLMHSMAFVVPVWQPVPAVVTIYDLSFLHFPDRFPPLKRWYLTMQSRHSCRRARRIVAISHSGREDIHHFFGVPRERIDVVSPGVDKAFRPYPEEEVSLFRRQQGLPDRFVLHVGTLQPRKNITVLIKALSRLGRPEIPLVLVGGKGWLYDEIFALVETLGLDQQVRFTGYVPDEQLPLWYNAASLFVFPSVYEGFGMPVIQAMACGTPVIVANTSALPEAAGEAGLLFSPEDVSMLVKQMLAVLDNPEQAVTMRERGYQQAESFSWPVAGRTLAESYRRALETSSNR